MNFINMYIYILYKVIQNMYSNLNIKINIYIYLLQVF